MKNSILIVFIIFYLNLSATIINVPADQPTIQAGINVAVDSDTVLVQPGTYNENIDFNGHRITVGSLFLTTADSSHIPLTVIDGGSSGSVISFQSGEDSTTVLTGFTIQNGFNWDGGGGILCNSSDPVIINNIIKDNLADTGGGIKCSSSNAKIINNIIHNNSFVSVLGNPGGGICCIDGSYCIIMFNIIHHNQNQDGGGIASFDSDPIISNNVIYENEAWDLGGGMRCLNSNAIIINNTFWGNTSTEAGGIYVDYGCNLTIVNNILWNNSPNEITGNVTVTYSDIEGGYAGIGNIDSDPL
ncbi:MAG: right-handed parallel beta-helix repeat-containing protein, partial [Candidatus Cloacimonetes bacterium]|nr:right-handed parallel beta-helix repeat-containing protein [Candidatus Cloacimonadota bacterium]